MSNFSIFTYLNLNEIKKIIQFSHPIHGNNNQWDKKNRLNFVKYYRVILYKVMRTIQLIGI